MAVVSALDAQVEALLAEMSPLDRVGQLFVITFDGADTSFESDIAELIYGYHIGGVVLSAANGNFSNEPGVDVARRVAVLANQLQGIAYGILLPADQALQPVPNHPWPPPNLASLEKDVGVAPPNLPLFVGIEQLGDNLPGTELRRGFTPLPSQLALGATWNPETTTEIGKIIGSELHAVGVNLLLGPNLDVVDQPRSDVVGSLGVFSFGGDPTWVSRMARAYISGVHTGSDGGIATFVRHFPGQGDIDRLPGAEIATIQKSLEELQRIAIPPFVAVTRSQPDLATADPAVTDGMISSHMYFGALQSATGRGAPISLDPGLSQVIQQQGLGDWRSDGGLVMSGPLGVPAIRKFYDPMLAEYPARRIALDAFNAGNDLLFLDRFSGDDEWISERDNIRNTIAFFQERYRNDAGFAAQVDAAVRRILKLKLRLYGEPDGVAVDGVAPMIPLSRVLASESGLEALGGDGTSSQAVAQIAREAITALYPDPASQTSPLPPPKAGENLLIITDSRLQQECSGCTSEAAVDPDAIARIILALYGPDATGQIQPEQLTSITFADLMQVLPADQPIVATGTPPMPASPTPIIAGDAAEGVSESEGTMPSSAANARIEGEIAEADWMIFAMLDVTPLYPPSEALRIFLSQRSEQLADKRIVVFALNSPYYLDATEISKLTQYYGAYGKTEPFLESAVAALFRSYSPNGAPSVSVPGTRFKSLDERLSPDPALMLPMQLRTGDVVLAANSDSGAAERAAPSLISVGETVRIEVGPILDRNGHQAPDGLIVSFEVRFEGAELALAVEPALVRSGIAVRDVRLERSGVLNVAAQAGEATSGPPFVLNVIEPPSTPTLAPTAIPTTTTAVVVSETPELTSISATEASPSAQAPADDAQPIQRANVVTLLLSLFVMSITLALALLTQGRAMRREALFAGMVWATVAGLLAYILYGVGLLPGSDWIAATFNVLGAPVVVFVAMLPPILWARLRSSAKSP